MVRNLIFLLFILLLCSEIQSLQLKKVLILSRHNLRTPLTSSLSRMTPKIWPKWNAEVGHLTEKGALLEKYMGEYFSAWLNKEELLPKTCPKENTVHIYANTRQRTKETAKAFAKAAFPNCNVPVLFKNITEMDPIFNPIVRNTTEAFRRLAKQEMQNKLANINLTDVYIALNDITDLKNSEICKEDAYCDLSKDKDVIFFDVGTEPNVSGPFFISNVMVDAFLMSFYEGLPLSDIGWGEIQNENHWKLLTKVVKENQNVRFNLTTAASDLARPLLKYINESIEKDYKLTVLVGHDSNLSPLLTCMRFESFVLPEQFELTPIGGKLVFQKWSDGVKNYLKVEFVYQSWKQLRNAEKLSLENPPKIITMHMKSCKTDDRGLCPWSDFKKVLKDLATRSFNTFTKRYEKLRD